MMWDKVIILTLLIGSLGGAWAGFNSWKIDLQNAATEKAVIQLKLSEEEQARKAVQEELLIQMAANDKLLTGEKELRIEIKEYLSIFKRHDLTMLSRAKPGLIETRINNATEKLFKEMEDESK